eukprot:g13392.t1
MAEGQRRKAKLLKLKEKVEADLARKRPDGKWVPESPQKISLTTCPLTIAGPAILAKEVALEEGLGEAMEHTGMHCLSLMEKIRLEDDYDKQEILMIAIHIHFHQRKPQLDDHVLARFYEERAKRKKMTAKLPALSPRTPSPEAKTAGSSEDDGGGLGSPLLSSRGRLRKDRRGLSPEALLTAADLSMRRKKRKKKKHHHMFDAVGSLVPATGQKAAAARQQLAERLGMSYKPPEDLGARVEHLKDLALLERLFEENEGHGRAYENQLLYSKYALRVAGVEVEKKEHFVAKKPKELKEVIAELRREMLSEGREMRLIHFPMSVTI